MHLSGFASLGRLALLCLALSLFHHHATARITAFTDLPSYSSLPICARRVASSIYDYRASQYCSNVAAVHLQSCICISSSFSFSRMASSSMSTCTSGADARSSVDAAVDAYCSQATAVTTNEGYMFTDLPQLDNLPPCARTALTSVFGHTSLLWNCPGSPGDVSECVCSSRSSSSLSWEISYSVSMRCKTWSLGGIYALNANSIWRAYCGAFAYPTTSAYAATGTHRIGTERPISFSVTDLLGYLSLGSCLTDPFSRVFSTAADYCSSESPAEFASCVCLNTAVAAKLTSALRLTAAYSCSNKGGGASGRATSMLNVYDAYCSVARREVAVTATAIGGSGAPYYRGVFDHDIENSGSTSWSRKRIIIGAVVGGLVGAGLIVGVILFFVLRKLAKNRKQRNAAAAAGYGMSPYGQPQYGPPAYAQYPPQYAPQSGPPQYGPQPGLQSGPELVPQNGPQTGPQTVPQSLSPEIVPQASQNVPQSGPQQLPPVYIPKGDT